MEHQPPFDLIIAYVEKARSALEAGDMDRYRQSMLAAASFIQANTTEREPTDPVPE